MSKFENTPNPISGEGVGIHEYSEEERARELGKTLQEYKDTVFFLKEGDHEARERLQNYIDNGRYYDFYGDSVAKKIAKELLEKGSFDTKPFMEREFNLHVHQGASHGLSVVDYLLNNKEKDWPWMKIEYGKGDKAA